MQPRPGHVWVHLPGDQPYAGLALQWRQTAVGWEAFVEYADTDDAVIRQWLPESQLEQVPGTPYTGSQYG